MVDVDYHTEHVALLRELKVGASPAPDWMPDEEPWYREYKDECLRTYLDQTKQLPRKPSMGSLAVDSRAIVGPLELLKHLQDEARARFTAAVLSYEPDTRPWNVRHTTKSEYPVVPVVDPVTWMVTRHGVFEAGAKVVACSDAVGPLLMTYAPLLPVAQCGPAWAERLALPNDLEALNEGHWTAMALTALSPTRLTSSLLSTSQRATEFKHQPSSDATLGRR